MEKIIYAVAAESIWTPAKGKVIQIPGRMSAQLGHALSRMRMHRMAAFAASWVGVRKGFPGNFKQELAEFADEAITTIHLSCRDEKELRHLTALLRRRGVRFYTFDDSNLDVYGPGEFTTAFATIPVRKTQVAGILDYLPLFAKDLK